jgi:hypothetical protein
LTIDKNREAQIKPSTQLVRIATTTVLFLENCLGSLVENEALIPVGNNH